jgi:hypothetical protein
MNATETLAPPEVRCPRCGAELAPEQDWCLECGTEVTLDRRSGGGRGPSPSLRRALVAGAVVLVAGVGLVALLGRGGGGDEAPTATERAQEPAQAPPGGSGARTQAEEPAPADQDQAGDARVPTWPQDEEGYTVVLLSTTDRAAAEGRALPLVRKGADVGILRSDEYEGFRPGSWVVWRGRYQRLFKAEEALRLLRDSGRSGEIKYVRRRS